MMKELWQLIKMLFSSKPGDFDTPKLLSMKHYPFKGYRFMMWCGRMIYRIENKENIEKYMQTYAGKESMTHETIHLRQAQAVGSWVKYYWRYFVEWIKGNHTNAVPTIGMMVAKQVRKPSSKTLGAPKMR